MSEALALRTCDVDLEVAELRIATLKRRREHWRAVPVPEDRVRRARASARRRTRGLWPIIRQVGEPFGDAGLTPDPARNDTERLLVVPACADPWPSGAFYGPIGASRRPGDGRASRTLDDCKPLQIDLAAMRDAQDQHAQDIVLDAHHDTPARDPVSLQRCRSGAGGAPERRPEGARVVRHRETLAKVAHDALRDRAVERAQVPERPGIEFNPPGQARAPPPRACRSGSARPGGR